MTELLIRLLLAYLLGSVNGSLLVGRLRGGVDIRTLGSGNAGGTNALRTQGKLFALAVMAIDVGKGWIAAQLLPLMPLTIPVPSEASAAGALRAWVPPACGLAAMLGHVYPLWHGFRGGKGAATLLGTLAGIAPALLVPVLATWFVCVMLFGFVGFATIAAATALPVAVLVVRPEPLAPLVAFGLGVAALIAFTHRGNIARMRAGTEPRAQRLWLLRR